MGTVDAEKLYSWLAGATPITFFVFDITERRTLYTNRQLVLSLGYTPEELARLGYTSASDFLHPDDVALWEASLTQQRTCADNDVVPALWRFRRSDGSYIWLSSFTSPLKRDPDGFVREVFGVAIEVTEQKETELALAQSQANLTALCENTEDAIFSVNRELELLAYNASFARLLRAAYSADAKVGLAVTEVLGEKQRDIWLSRAARALNGERFQVHERVRILDRHVDVETSFNPIVGRLGQVEGVAVFSRDITERKRMETALLDAESRLRILADRAQDVVAVYRVKPTPVQEYISPSVEKLVGYPPQAFYDDPQMHFRLIHPDDREMLDEFTRAFPKNYDQTITFRWIHKNGHPVWVELNMVPIYDNNSGELIAVESISRDVTAKVQLEEQLRQSQKIEAVGRLAGGIAHDFNNLLGVVMGNVELARRNLADPVLARHYLDSIEDAAQRGVTLTRQLLSFSRPQVARLQLLDLNDTIGNIQSMLSRLLREDIGVSLSLSADLPLVRCDPGQLEQLLLNLAVNARDAMPDGGEIDIRTCAVERAHELIRSRVWGRPPSGRVVALSVRDSGIGMDAATLARAFDEFFTTKSRGTGLGLSIVRRIAESNGGAVAVESEVGVGTTFTVIFPRAAEQPISMRRVTARAASMPGATILLVEDEAPLRRLARVILSAEGYRVIEASTPEEALERGREAGEIDLLLTDVLMPCMNGPTLAKALLGQRSTLEVLYMSGAPDEELASQGVSLDASRAIKKPFSASELLERVAAALRRETRNASLA